MKRLTILLTGVMLVGAVALAAAGDFHYGSSLICSDCHTAHASQQHGYTVGGIFTPIGPDKPYERLLRNDRVMLCLSCHNGTSFAPDVFGANGGTVGVRESGGLNTAANSHGLSNDAGYDDIDGHTLYSMAMPPGGAASGYVADATEGLWCGSCHGVHGYSSYRNLRRSGIFAGDTLTYAVGTNDLTKDVFERSAGAYTTADIDFNEPNVNDSKYALWCQDCHTDFHGAVGSANMGGGASPYKRHPVAVVNMSTTANYTTSANKLKVMDSQGLWIGTGTDNTLTPSCMTCHKAHGNKNAFGLVFVTSPGGPPAGAMTEEGDGGLFRDLCRQCHRQGNL
jgi:hypothetical protein